MKLSVFEKICMFGILGVVVVAVGFYLAPRSKEPKTLPPELQAQYEKRMSEKEAARKAKPIEQPQDPAPTKTDTTQAQEKFKQWALCNLAVTDIAIKSHTLFVTLTADKYTTKPNVVLIANDIARAYCLQTKERAAVCRIYLGKELYAKGDYGM